MDNDSPGTLISQGSIMRINNALIEEASCVNNSNGFIIISYSPPELNNTAPTQKIRLNLSDNTVIMNSFGQRLCVCCLQTGMWVNVAFSARMTRSIPPQTNAFLVVVQRRVHPPSYTTIDRIAFVNALSNVLVTGTPNDISSQTRFNITNQTSIRNRSGESIRLSALRPGQLVKIIHANFQTASIPPQTTAFSIRQI